MSQRPAQKFRIRVTPVARKRGGGKPFEKANELPSMKEKKKKSALNERKTSNLRSTPCADHRRGAGRAARNSREQKTKRGGGEGLRRRGTLLPQKESVLTALQEVKGWL